MTRPWSSLAGHVPETLLWSRSVGLAPACCGFLLSCDVFCLKGGCSFSTGLAVGAAGFICGAGAEFSSWLVGAITGGTRTPKTECLGAPIPAGAMFWALLLARLLAH